MIRSDNKEQKDKKNKESDMDKNFLLISLEEKKAKKIAEVLSNDTCRKVLDALSKKEYTETELSKELSIPISTVHYNLKQLQEANLVIVDEFHYSSKGKEINHYKLANKYIIIAPKNDSKIIDALKKIMPVAIITVIVAGVIELISRFTARSYGAVQYAAKSTADTGANVMSAIPSSASSVAPSVAEISRPAMQSNITSLFLIGMASVIVIYFVYEIVRKR